MCWPRLGLKPLKRRESLWLGLRDAEDEGYRAEGGDFRSDEVSYRRGYRRGQDYHKRVKESYKS